MHHRIHSLHDSRVPLEALYLADAQGPRSSRPVLCLALVSHLVQDADGEERVMRLAGLTVSDLGELVPCDTLPGFLGYRAQGQELDVMALARAKGLLPEEDEPAVGGER